MSFVEKCGHRPCYSEKKVTPKLKFVHPAHFISEIKTRTQEKKGTGIQEQVWIEVKTKVRKVIT